MVKQSAMGFCASGSLQVGLLLIVMIALLGQARSQGLTPTETTFVRQLCAANAASPVWSSYTCSTFIVCAVWSSNPAMACILGGSTTSLCNGIPGVYGLKQCTLPGPMVLPASVATLIGVSRVDVDGPQPNIQGLDLTGLTALTEMYSIGPSNVQTWPLVASTVNVSIQNAVGILGLPSVRRVSINDSILTELRAPGANPSLLALNNVSVSSPIAFAATAVLYPLFSLLPQSQWPGVRATYSTFTGGITNWAPNAFIISFDHVSSGSLAPPPIQTIFATFLDSNFEGNFALTTDSTSSRMTGLDFRRSEFDGFEGAFGDRLLALTIEECSNCRSTLPQLPAATQQVLISQTNLVGPISIPASIVSYIARLSRFNGTIPVSNMPPSLEVLDIRDNFLDLCSGVPQMGPKFPTYVPADSIYIFPQQVDVTCFCVAGACLSGNAFPGHYDSVPATYRDLECDEATRPFPDTPCWLGFWTIASDLTISSQLDIETPLSIHGDFQVTGTGNLHFSDVDSPILVKGTVNFDNDNGAQFQVKVDDYMIETLIEKEKKAKRIKGPPTQGAPETITITVPLIRSDSKVLLANPSDIPLLVSHTEGMCHQVSASQASVLENSIVTIFSINTGGCGATVAGPANGSKSNTSTGTIALIAIGCVVGLAVIIVIIVVIVSSNQKCRQTVRPFENART